MAIPVKDTIKEVVGGIVKCTPDRDTLRAVQTPQVFDFDMLRAALKKAILEEAKITDDCSAIENMGMSVNRHARAVGAGVRLVGGGAALHTVAMAVRHHHAQTV